MYGVPHEVTFKVKLTIIQTCVFHTKKEYIYTCSNIISVVYTRRIISYLKGITLFNHIPHKEGSHLLKIKKLEKRSMPITKTKHV